MPMLLQGGAGASPALSQFNHKGCKPCGPYCSGLLDLVSPKLNAHPLADRLNAYGACHRSYKGSALALLVEILGGALAGGAVEAKAALQEANNHTLLQHTKGVPNIETPFWYKIILLLALSFPFNLPIQY